MPDLLTAARIGRIERLVVLRSFPGWSDLPSSDLAAAAAIARPLHAPKGRFLLKEGEPVTRIYFLAEGEVALRRGGRSLGRVTAPGVVGGIAAFAGDPRGYDCEALTDALVLELRAEDMEELFEERFEFLVRVARGLALRTIDLRKKLPNGGFPPAAPIGPECPARPLDLVERIFFLRHNLALASGRIDSIAALAKGAPELRLAPGKKIFSVGDPADFMLALVCGSVVGTLPNGETFEFGANDIVGSLDAIAGAPRWYDAEVKDGLVALRLDRDTMIDVWEDHPDVGLDVLRAFGRSLLALLERAAT